MLIHIGNGYIVRGDDVIGIFDLDGDVTGADTAEFLKRCEREGRTETSVLDLPRSFVLTECDGRERVILSHISSPSLAGRDRGF